MTTYDFDSIIPRQDTQSFKWDRYRGTDILPFWVADMDFAVAPEIRDALQQRLSHPIYGYASAPPELAPAICHYLWEQYQWAIEEHWIVWLPGVVPGLVVSCQAFGEPGDQAITFPPIYHHFLSVADYGDKELVQIPLIASQNQYDIDWQALEQALSVRSRLILLCSPHNPVGKVFSATELQRLATLAERFGSLIISDEIHHALVLDQNHQHIPTAQACAAYADNIVTLMSPSKTFNLAGLNCSFAIIQNPVLRRQFSKVTRATQPMVPALAYEAALAAYRDGKPWHDALIQYLRQNYSTLKATIDALPNASLTPLQATYLGWIDLRSSGLDNPRSYLENTARIGLSAGEEFGREGQGFVRFNFACPRQTLDQGLERLQKALLSLT